MKGDFLKKSLFRPSLRFCPQERLSGEPSTTSLSTFPPSPFRFERQQWKCVAAAANGTALLKGIAMPDHKYLSTREAARVLGISPRSLQRAIWDGRLNEPARGPGNVFLWTPTDIERVSRVLVHKPHGSQKGKGTRQRADVRFGDGTPDRPAQAKTGRKKAWLILSWLRNWQWRLFDRATKAFFDAFFDHYSG
jgi:hypothetical protein